MTTLQLYHIINTTTGRPISAPGPVGHPALEWDITAACKAMNDAANPDPTRPRVERYKVEPYAVERIR